MPFFEFLLVLHGLSSVICVAGFKPFCCALELLCNWLGLPLGVAEAIQLLGVVVICAVEGVELHEVLVPHRFRVEFCDFGLQLFDPRAELIGGLAGLANWFCVHAVVCRCCCIA